jgi:hypothetical protein
MRRRAGFAPVRNRYLEEGAAFRLPRPPQQASEGRLADRPPHLSVYRNPRKPSRANTRTTIRMIHRIDTGSSFRCDPSTQGPAL